MPLAKTERLVYNDGTGREEGSIFNIGFSEIILILLVAFLIVGPKDLPKVARWLGRQVKKARQLIREIKAETGWDDLEKEFKSVQADVKTAAAQADVTGDLKQAADTLEDSLRDAGDSGKDALK